ncbi:VRR-NUC domain-containing protein [Hymenobacter sp. UYP22]|uniref:VRR-NUC domain-containing protein n=1 Tax=Hymenobacter sp. UYP22 TaxID=3156348 RepID=UPI00339336FF
MGKFTLPPHLQKRIINDTSPATRAPPADQPPTPSTDTPAKARKTRNTSATNNLTSAIRDLLGMLGCYIWRHNNAGVYDPHIGAYRSGSSKRGLPDTLGFYQRTGHIIAVEVKYGKDTLTDEQREFLDEVRAAGGFACEGRSLEQVRREFNQWKQSLHFNQAA